MKKGLMIAGAAVLLVSGLGASVFAKYTGGTDGKTGDITAKQFVVTEASDSVEAKYADVKLAPGESTDYSYSVVNYSGSIISEVDINVTFGASLSGDLADALVISKASYECVLAKDAKSTGTYSFTISFPNAENNNDFIGKSATVAITCSAVQA